MFRCANVYAIERALLWLTVDVHWQKVSTVQDIKRRKASENQEGGVR